RSRLGQTRQRLICWPSIAPAGIAIVWWQWGQSRSRDSADTASRAARPHPGQLYVIFIGETNYQLGWVEFYETHQLRRFMVGLAELDPPYQFAFIIGDRRFRPTVADP